eukprot:14921681-Alexandrium_andersonii.AAC.1
MLVEVSAFPGSDAWAPVADGQVHTWAMLEKAGFVASKSLPDGGRAGQLTKTGVGHITIACPQRFAQPVCAVRPGLALPDRTTYELMVLVSEKFEWSCHPNDPAQRQALLYAVSDPESQTKWYTSMHSAPRSYLLCLLDAQRVHDQFHQVVPHWVPQKAEDQYDKLFRLGVAPDCSLPSVGK